MELLKRRREYDRKERRCQKSAGGLVTWDENICWTCGHGAHWWLWLRAAVWEGWGLEWVERTRKQLFCECLLQREAVSQPLSHYCPLRSLFRHFSLIASIPWNFKPQVHCVSVYVLYVYCYWYIKWVQYIFTSWKISFTWYHPCWEYSILA